MTRKTEQCDRCEEHFTELFPTTMGWLCEGCAWAVSERETDGQVYAELAGMYRSRSEVPTLEQAPGKDAQAQVQQGQQ